MGACSTKKQKHENQDIQIIEIPKQEEQISTNQQLLELFHKFTQLIELMGNTDDLNNTTRESISKLIRVQKNIQILIQCDLKQQMKKKNINKQSSKEDEFLLYQEESFLNRVSFPFLEIIQVLDKIEKDPEFENAYPILSQSFVEINQQIKLVPLKIAVTKTKATIMGQF